MNRIQVKRLSTEHLSDVYMLGRQIFSWPSEHVMWNQQLVQWYLDNACIFCFVAEHNNRTVGFTLSGVSEQVGYIGWIGVDPLWRRQGIATQLVHRSLLIFQVTGITKSICMARDDGQVNRMLERLGFCSTGFRKIDLEIELRANEADQRNKDAER